MIARTDAQRGAGEAWEADTLVIADFPLPDKRLCGNTRIRALHLAGLRRDQRRWAQLAAYGALGGREPPAWVRGPVAVEYDVFRTRHWAARPLDFDNFVMGAKGIADGLADALGVTDSRWRTTAVRWHTAVNGSGGVTITLRPGGAAGP